jgi:hypothetical protein
MVVMAGQLKRLFFKELSVSTATGFVFGAAWIVAVAMKKRNTTIAYYANLNKASE